MGLARLDNVVLRSGAKPGISREVQLSPVTVLVGPNNAGKSTALVELQQFSGHNREQGPWDGGRVVRSAEIAEFPSTSDEVHAFLAPRLLDTENDEFLRVRDFQAAAPMLAGIPVAGAVMNQGYIDMRKADLDPAIASPGVVADRLLSTHTLSLDGKQRFNLAQGVHAGRLDNPPTSAWMSIERDSDLFEEVDAMVFAAFEQHIVVQTFEPPNLFPALSSNGISAGLRQSTSEAAVAAQKAATRLTEFSDGVQVFCGMITAIAALPHLLLLIDEPEAFLHPTLSRRLGADLARIAKERDARLIAATHSAEFLLGCLDEVPDTTVLRLDYRRSVPSSHVMTSNEVSQLSKDPLLRSSNALQALFARSAVVCEADPDRAFYNEINRRLQRSDGRVGALDTQFLNAQNWQTTARLAGPLRSAGVPAAVILDLETLARDEMWPDLVQMTGVDQELRDDLLTARASARDAIVDLGRVVTDGPFRAKIEGIDAFDDGGQKDAVKSAVRKFAKLGIYLVQVGELEGWLSQLGCTNKKTWVTDILGRLGAPGDAAYVEPGEGDVWEFVEGIADWLEDPNRAGMPDS